MELGSCQRDVYLQASYNGVAFTAKEITSEHGRRSAIGEFPFGESTAGVDMGRKVRRYGLQARLDEDDHQARSALLIAACELPGPGILVHPTRGVLNVTCESLRVSNDVIEKQGVTEISLEFVEFNLWENGLGLVGSLLGLVLRPLLEDSSAAFTGFYSPRNEPIYLQDATFQTASDTAVAFKNGYLRTSSPDPKIAADLRQIETDTTLQANAAVMDELVRKGSAAISKNSSSADQKYDIFRAIANWAVSVPQTTTSQEAIASHTRITSGAYMAQAALDREYTSIEQATVVLDSVSSIFTQEARAAYDACQNALFTEIARFSADFTRQMYRVVYGTPRKQRYDFKGRVPALVAAYSIWDDAKRAREIGTGLVGPIVVVSPNG